MYEGADIDDTVLAGKRELKGSVTIKGVPVEVSYGMQYLIITSGFDISKIGFNFKLKGIGTSFVDSQLSNVSQKYSIYTADIQSRIEKQAKANDAEMDSKGFVFNVLNGMSGGQKASQAVEGEIRSRVTGSIAAATGLPASLVGALVGGANMKQAMKAYEKSVTTEAISKATGIPSWYLDQKMAEKEATHAMSGSFSYNLGRGLATYAMAAVAMSPYGLVAMAVKPDLMKQANKFADHIGKEAYKNRETIDAVVTVAAAVAAPFTGGGSLIALAAYKAVEGATEGGVLGALAGAANVGNAFLYEFTGGMVSYNLSYSYADGFGASVGGGMKIVEGLGVGATLSYNEQSGFGGSVGLQAGTTALSFNAGLSYSQRDGISGSAGIGVGLGKNANTGAYSASLNLGVSYNRQDGFGANAGLSSNNNKITHGSSINISRSEYGGFGADISTNQYGPGQVSGGLAYSQRDGFTASLNVNGTNALSYNSQTGLSANSDFLSQYAMNNALAQGVAQTDEEKAHAARQEAESRAAQNRNNAQQGADTISGIGRRLDEDGFELHHTVDGHDESSDNIGGDNGNDKGKKPTLNEVEAMMNRFNKFQEGLDGIRNTKTSHHDPSQQEGSNVVKSVKTEKGENGKTKITVDRVGTVGFDAETTPFFSKDAKGNLVPVTGASVSSPFIGHRDVTQSAHNGIDVISHAFRASANLEVTNITHGASRSVGGDPTKQAGIWMQDGKLMTYSTVDENGKAHRDKSGRPETRPIEYTAALAAQNNISAQDHSKLLNHAMSNPNQYHGNGNSVTGRYTMSDGSKVDLIYKHAPSLEGLQNGKPVNWQKGDMIQQGAMVLPVGSTGRSTGPHAHFEVQSRSTFGLDPNKDADLIHKIKDTNLYAIDGRYFTNNILKKDLENQ